MAHMIEGNNAFFTGKPAWHNLGTVLESAPDIDTALQLAYPWTLVETNAIAELNGETIKVPARKFIFRSDGKYIADVGKDYGLVQPRAAFNFFAPWLASGLVELEAGGSLCDGTRMWILARVKGSETEIVKGDSVKAYILAATSFDGSLHHCIGDTRTRVVCNNTLQAALGNDADTIVKLKHTSGIHSRINDVQADISARLNQFQKDCEAYKVLAAKPINAEKTKAYVTEIFAPKVKPAEITTRTENVIRHVIDLTQSQRTLELVPAARGTYWAAYNGVTQYLTHERCNNDDNRLNSQWFGESANIGTRALQLALAA